MAGLKGKIYYGVLSNINILNCIGCFFCVNVMLRIFYSMYLHMGYSVLRRCNKCSYLLCDVNVFCYIYIYIYIVGIIQ